MALLTSTKVFCVCCCLAFMVGVPSVNKFASGHNILLLPFPWPSHFALMEIIGVELDRLGHDVTIAVPSLEGYTEKTKLKRIVYNVKAERNAFVSIAERRLKLKQGFGVSWLSEFSRLVAAFGEAVLETDQIHLLGNTTDLIISDTAFFVAPVIATHLKIPWIYLSPFGHMAGLQGDMWGAAVNPSYIPVYMAAATLERASTGQYMNFLERALNLFFSICTWAVRELIINRSLDNLTAKYGTDSGTVLTRKTSLVLIPMDYAFEYPRMDSPHIKLIGPLTACTQKGDLESPFSDIANEADGRFVVVSLGTTGGLHMADAVRLLEAVQAINYTVIMKYNTSSVKFLVKDGHVGLYTYNSDHLRNLRTDKDGRDERNRKVRCTHTCSIGTTQATAKIINVAEKRQRNMKCTYCKKKWSNKGSEDSCIDEDKTKLYYSVVHEQKQCSPYPVAPKKQFKGACLVNSTYVFDFLPQQKLLQYNKNSILLTHCDLNSVYEAPYHGRLIICMPLFGDHFESAGRVLSRKLGRVVLLGEMNKERLQYELDILTQDKSYLDNVRKASKRLKRRKMSPVEEAAFWIEAVLSDDENMDYLKPSFGHLSLPSYLCLDVIVFWLAIVGILMWLISFVYRKMWKRQH